MTNDELTVGDTIDRRYVLKREIARGGIGVVFEATHAVTGATVAIKTLYGSGRKNAETRARLLREARALAAVRHRHVVEVLDAGFHTDASPYLVMEMLDGRPLDGILASRTRLGVTDVANIGWQMCEALGFMHARGVLHRDLKPSNVFVARDSQGAESIKLIDLGIASVAPFVAGESAKLTVEGGLYGTAEYMSPEQLLARPADPRSDLYSLGVTLFECLTGDVPFAGSVTARAARIMSTPHAPSVREIRPEVPHTLETVIQRALARSPDDRFQDASSFGRALRTALGAHAPELRLLAGGSSDRDATASFPGVAAFASAPGAAHPDLRRRRFPRAAYMAPVRIIFESGEVLDARVEDISEGGVLAVTPRACEPSQSVRIRFALPTSGDVVTLAATVRWVKPSRGRNAMGVEFDALTEPVRQAIRTYVKWICADQPSEKTAAVNTART